MKRVRPTPLGALVRGLIAGAVGSAAQTLFFKLTSGVKPASRGSSFSPPERAQLEERETETVARRFIEYLMQRPISGGEKEVGATVVHYAFGAAWGGLYGLARESLPPARSPAASLVLGGAVWLFGDELIVPTFGLAGWAGAYPLKVHAYALAAHLAYGAATWAAYEALRPRSLAAAAAALWALDINLTLTPRVPRSLRPLVRTVLSSAAKVRARRPIAAAVEGMRAP